MRMLFKSWPPLTYGIPSWRWWAFALFWSVFYVLIHLFITLGVVESAPERAWGWSGGALAVLLLLQFATHGLISFGRLYCDECMTIARTVLAICIQLLVSAALVYWYDPGYSWLSIALVYQGIGGLPARWWVVPIGGVLALMIFASLPTAVSGSFDYALAASSIILTIVNGGIAVFIREQGNQRLRLHNALVELREAHAALAASAAQQEELAVLRERTRLARDMHDDIGHALVLMNIKLEAAQLLYARDPVRGDAELEATRQLIRATMNQLRDTLADLRAPAVHRAALPFAMRNLATDFAARSGVMCDCFCSDDLPDPAAEVRDALWQVGREALVNVERHALATHATISVSFAATGWYLLIKDNGRGIRAAELEQPAHYGLIGMRERMAGVGGSLVIHGGVEGGTVVEAWAPAKEQAHD